MDVVQSIGNESQRIGEICAGEEKNARACPFKSTSFFCFKNGAREMSLMVLLLVKESKNPPRQEETPK